MIAALILAVAMRTYSMHLPTKLAGPGAAAGVGDSTAHSWMHAELWYLPADSAHRVPGIGWPLFAHRLYVASSRDSSPGALVTITVPDTLRHGAAFARAVNKAGAAPVWSNIIESRKP